MYACLLFSYILVDRILQLPRGKGHRGEAFTLERQPQHRDHPTLYLMTLSVGPVGVSNSRVKARCTTK